jgi:hypothetical protein
LRNFLCNETRGKFVALQLYGPLLVRDKPSITRLVLTLIVLVVVVVTIMIMTTMKRKILVCDMNHVWVLAVLHSHEMLSDMKLISYNRCI